MPSYDAVRRRLIVCCDGTWQSSVSGERNIPSNVTRMCRHLAREQVVQEKNEKTGKTETVLYNQMVFYDPGIGTGELSKEDVSIQGGTGAGLATNVIEAYNWLVLNYQPGDKVYCFGFSRGAYTARSLSGFITTLGICKPTDMMFFPWIYEQYESGNLPEVKGEDKVVTQRREAYKQAAKCWMSGTPLDVPFPDEAGDTEKELTINTGARDPIDQQSRHVEIVGVWDTVGSLGVPKIGGEWKLPSKVVSWFVGSDLDKPGRQFHDVTLSDNVHHAFHALALDERRLPFAPTLWYVPFGQKRPDGYSLKQVWFPGVHINAGGGSDDILKKRVSDLEQIASVTFSWMVQQCRPHLAFNEDSLEKAMSAQQLLLKNLSGEPYHVLTAKSGWSIGKIIDSFEDASAVIKAGGQCWRSPGETVQPESLGNLVEHRTTELGITNEEIHPSVYYRQTKLSKKSPSLGKFKRQAKQNPKEGWEYVGTGVNGKPLRIPEYRINPHDDDTTRPRNIERLLAHSNGAEEYLSTLDKMYLEGKDMTKPDTVTYLAI